jgi:hypothetical protein
VFSKFCFYLSIANLSKYIDTYWDRKKKQDEIVAEFVERRATPDQTGRLRKPASRLSTSALVVLIEIPCTSHELFATAPHVLQRDKHVGIALALPFLHIPFVALELALNDLLERV